MKFFKILKFIELHLTSVVALASSAVLFACSESSNTAGVWTETESGQTASLTVVMSGIDSNSATVKLALTRTIDNRTTIIDSAIVDSNLQATFKKVPYNDFSIVAAAYDQEENNLSSSLISSESLAKSDLLTDSGFVESTIKMNLHKSALLQVRNDIAELSIGDSLCISRTLSCGIYDETAQDAGYITITNVPSDISYSQIEIVSAKGTHTQPVSWNVTTTDTLHVTHQGVSQINKILSFTLSKVSYLDSLSDKTLDSLLVPFKKESEDSLDFFQDKNWNFLPQVANSIGKETFYWITLPPMDSSVEISYGTANFNKDETVSSSRVLAFKTSVNAGDTVWQTEDLFRDSSIAISFWATLDSAKSELILSAVQSEIGFEIRRCDSDKKAICTKIYNGIDTAATDTMEYGKSKLFDGERHHYSLVIHKKHLSIVVDGQVIRSTDLKLSEKFYKLKDLIVGADIENLLLYSFGDFIRKPEDKSWHRLNAWLQAFYELQK